MRIEERGYSMITDEQGREWLLQKLYDDGWRYCTCMTSGNVYLTDKKPEKCVNGEVSIYGCEKTGYINGLKNMLFNKLKRNEVLEIAEELGIVNWSKVPVDTPIYVRAYESNAWEKRHFAFFKDGKVYAWLSGVTSWSAEDTNDVFSWNYAKLAEV